ncbi:endoglucanase 2-like [Salvia miltiorrhiza]|uniref:endoglucanase 2-like n=1 Tax=Salvia miltiorrhiza TaxID=226208 RepID=UPI0025AB92CE|nr:endoglucanase 2-like [Salvia miltiorrhiza]
MRERKKKSGGCWGWFLLLIVLGGIAFAVFVVLRNSKSSSVFGSTFSVSKKYADALKIALQFLDVQKSGKLEDNKISWRGDSALKDGSEAKLNLSMGMYDAGDHIKFGFPMAFTATVLSWAILEYGAQMKLLDQLEPAQNSLKWITDFLINAHPADNLLYIQVGDPKLDHSCWNKPEDMTEPRPLTMVNASAPGTEVAAETAAALASASLVYKSVDSVYSSLLLKHARQLFAFADKYRMSYSISIPQVGTYYNSTGYGDELLWAAAWLYHATAEQPYMDFLTGKNADEFGDWGNPTWFSWDNKLPGAQVLISRISFVGGKGKDVSIIQKYRDSAEAVMCGLLPESPSATSSRTDSGLIWVSEWNALQHPVASAFLAVVYSDYMHAAQAASLSCDGSSFTAGDLREFAVTQVEYVLGNNPMEMSYVVGYGVKYPEYVHHRGASIPEEESPRCKEGFKWLDSDEPNPNVAVGALVGGPFLNETYVDARNNSMQGEPTTYNSALIVALLSSLLTSPSSVTPFA